MNENRQCITDLRLIQLETIRKKNMHAMTTHA